MTETKITIIGTTGSGKTCYLAGMYNEMSGFGKDGFTLCARNPSDDKSLTQKWGLIEDKNKWPPLTDNKETIEFKLAYKYKSILEFDWLDYPGGILEDRNDALYSDFISHAGESACLLLIVDGETFNCESSDEEGYKDKVVRNLRRKLVHEVQELPRIADENGGFMPPVGIVITKADLIPVDVKVVDDIIKRSFEGSPFFSSSTGGNDIITCIMPVTLGENVSNGDVDPVNIEQPIAFAVLNVLRKYICIKQSSRNRTDRELTEITETWWGRTFRKGEIEEIRAELAIEDDFINTYGNDIIKLTGRFPNEKSIYINGVKKDLKEYFRSVL